MQFSNNKTEIYLHTVSQTSLHNAQVMQRRQILDRVVSVVKMIGKRGRSRAVAAAPKHPNWGGGARPTLGAQVSLKLLFGYVTIFSSADLFTTDLNCRKKLACDIISECYVILSRRI